MTACPCGQPARVLEPTAMCQPCAEAYYRGLVRVGAGLAELRRSLAWDGPRRTPGHWRGRLTAETVQHMRDAYGAGRSLHQVARDVGCSFGNVYHIVTGKTWKHAGGPIAIARPVNHPRRRLQRIA